MKRAIRTIHFSRSYLSIQAACRIAWLDRTSSGSSRPNLTIPANRDVQLGQAPCISRVHLEFLAGELNHLRALTQTKPSHGTCRRRPGTLRRATRLVLLVVVVICSVTSLASPASSQSSGTSGYEVKSAFLFNFAKYIDWPTTSFANPQSPFSICVLGRDPFGNILDETLLGKVVDGRPLLIQRLKDKTGARSCQLVFVSSSESAHLPEIFASVQGANVLLIGETAGFAVLGGTIEFTLNDDHVGFAINTDAVNRSGLKFSSKLLALAKIVHDNRHSQGG